MTTFVSVLCKCWTLLDGSLPTNLVYYKEQVAEPPHTT